MKMGLMGTGLMGEPLGDRLLGAGHSLTLYNRTVEKTQGLVKRGALAVKTPAEVIAQSEVIVLMLADAAAIEDCLFAEAVDWTGRTVLQMGTIAPQESQAIAAKLMNLGGRYLEAPVLGSIPEARSGSLIIMVGADPEDFDRLLPILQLFGSEPKWLGPVGNGAVVKLALNQLIGSLTAGFSLSLGLVQRSGAPVEGFMEILRQSALYAPTFDKKLQRMLDRDYQNPNFPTQHLLKDMRLFNTAALPKDLNTEVSVAIASVLTQAMAQNLAALDYSAIYDAIAAPQGLQDNT
jgi:3-hydroxyisobutyrate dehydrogenase